MEPVVLRNVFPADVRESLLLDVSEIIKKQDVKYEDGYGRYISNNAVLNKYSDLLLPVVRDTFGDLEILPSYLCWAQYAGARARLERHKDLNACTYTVDYCVTQLEPWELYVEGVSYLLEENDALLFMGEEQEHWRPRFPPGNRVEMIFFHYVRPDHWFFNGGPPTDKGMM